MFVMHAEKGKSEKIEDISVLQIRRGKRDNLGIFSIFLLYNISCDPLPYFFGYKTEFFPSKTVPKI